MASLAKILWLGMTFLAVCFISLSFRSVLENPFLSMRRGRRFLGVTGSTLVCRLPSIVTAITSLHGHDSLTLAGSETDKLLMTVNAI